MKKNFYFQHSLMSMFDPRMKHLVDNEGLRGLGAYWIIIEKLSILPEPRAQLDYLREIIAVNKPDVFADRLFNGFIPSFSRSGIKMGKNTDISIISPIFLCYPQTSVSRPVIIEYYLI